MNTSRHQPGVNARPGRTSRSMVYPAYKQSGPKSPMSLEVLRVCRKHGLL
ncbi:hypothetical protein JOE56_001743 [Brevibacterium paucivorans]|uniref:Uncharacterized protein n=1 Tax=Brevibacterium paucivorans TaxID=170994 RepID=A0ABS2SNC9_9MICO|nr:hypothetical protein [Brevibacterium paucivorans]